MREELLNFYITLKVLKIPIILFRIMTKSSNFAKRMVKKSLIYGNGNYFSKNYLGFKH